MLGLLVIAGAALGATCPERLPDEYADDARSSGRVILVVKDARLVGVYENDRLVPDTCFTVQLGPGADDGPKRRLGDMRTPEGWYAVSHRNPKSAYHLSVGINYPNFDDVMRGIEDGVIDLATGNALTADIEAGRLPGQRTALGGEIFLHGNPKGWTNDWTLGCVGMRNADMNTIYRLADLGTPVLILPALGESESAAR